MDSGEHHHRQRAGHFLITSVGAEAERCFCIASPMRIPTGRSSGFGVIRHIRPSHPVSLDSGPGNLFPQMEVVSRYGGATALDLFRQDSLLHETHEVPYSPRVHHAGAPEDRPPI